MAGKKKLRAALIRVTAQRNEAMRRANQLAHLLRYWNEAHEAEGIGSLAKATREALPRVPSVNVAMVGEA